MAHSIAYLRARGLQEITGQLQRRQYSQVFKDGVSAAKFRKFCNGVLAEKGNPLIYSIIAEEALKVLDNPSHIQRPAETQFQEISVGERIVVAGENEAEVIGENFGIAVNKGRKSYKIQEDSAAYLKLSDDCQIFIISDGMGGHEAGDVASRLIVETYTQSRLEGKDLLDSVKASFQKVAEKAAEDDRFEKMGSTLAVLEIDKKQGQIRIINIGDSRVKFVDAEKALLLTRDHNMIWHWTFSKQEEKLGTDLSVPWTTTDDCLDRITDYRFDIWKDDNLMWYYNNLKGRINSAIQKDGISSIDYITIPLVKAEQDATATFLIYSDGAIDGDIHESTITQIVRSTRDKRQTAKEILKSAYELGSLDNLAVISSEVTGMTIANEGMQVERYGIRQNGELVHRETFTWA